MVESVTELALAFVTVTTCAGLVELNAWLANVRPVGLKVNGAAAPPVPVPESVTSCWRTIVLSATVAAPLMLPFAVGVNVTDIVQLFPAARLVPHGEVPLPAAA